MAVLRRHSHPRHARGLRRPIFVLAVFAVGMFGCEDQAPPTAPTATAVTLDSAIAKVLDPTCSGCIVDEEFVRKGFLPNLYARLMRGERGADGVIEVATDGDLGKNVRVNFNGRSIEPDEKKKSEADSLYVETVDLRELNLLIVEMHGKQGSKVRVRVRTAATLIGPGGGVVATGTGLTLTIPARALTAPTMIQIEPVDASDVPMVTPNALLAPPVRLLPDGLRFSTPVALEWTLASLPSAAQSASLSTTLLSEGGVETVPVTRTTTAVRAQIRHFSTAYLAVGGPWQVFNLKWTTPTIRYRVTPAGSISDASLRHALAQWQGETSGFLFEEATGGVTPNLVVEGVPTNTATCPGFLLDYLGLYSPPNGLYGVACVPTWQTVFGTTLGSGDQALVRLFSMNVGGNNSLAVREGLHEVGHALGIGHTVAGTLLRDAAMTSREDTPDRVYVDTLTTHDIAAVRFHYGVPQCDRLPYQRPEVVALEDAQCRIAEHTRATPGSTLDVRADLMRALRRAEAAIHLRDRVGALKQLDRADIYINGPHMVIDNALDPADQEAIKLAIALARERLGP